MSIKLPTHFGPFDVECRIGRGGMGAVYRGINPTTQESVAIKVLAEPLLDDENFRQRFDKEIEALRQLRHPNIVRLLGSGLEGDFCYYVMELVDGSSLEQEIRSGRRFSWREALDFGIQIASALNCAHNNGIVHRDLKPANLLLTSQGTVKLSDFGIATLFGSSKITSLGSIIGTLNYMSPEQASAQPVTMRSDLFSFGVVLTAIMAGTPPFSATTLPEILRQHASGRARRPSQMGVDIPVEFDEFIGRLLELNPEKRPKNAYFVLRRLEALLEELQDTPGTGHQTTETLSSSDSLSDNVSNNTLNNVQNSVSDNILDKLPDKLPTDVLRQKILEYRVDNQTILELNHDKSCIDTSETVTLDALKKADDSTISECFEPKENTSSNQTGSHSFFRPEVEEEKQPATTNDSPWAALLMVLVLSGISIVFVAHLIRSWGAPPDVDTLYARIVRAERDEKASSSERYYHDVDLFLTCYSTDPRATQVKELQAEIDLDRLEKNLLLDFRKKHFRAVAPIERDYLRAIRNLQTQPIETQQKLEDFIRFYDATIETLRKTPKFSHDELMRNTQYLMLARRQLHRIQQVLKTEREMRRELITLEIERVHELLRSTDPEEVEQGEALRMSILRLFSSSEPEIVVPLQESQTSR